MSNKAYDRLKFIALTIPFISAFIISIMKIWNIPYAVEVGLTLAAINTVVSEIVKLLNKKYKAKKGN